jgi:hypothetical protein
MTIHEPACVALKRRGAEYVAQLLRGKSEQERLEFWRRRTERLLSKRKQNRGDNNAEVHNPALQRTNGQRV